MTAISTISPTRLAAEKENVELIDVRTPAEFRGLHAAFARNLPLDQLDPESVIKDRNGAEQPIYLICRSGSRSEKACAKFVAAGYDNVISVEGGTEAWEAAGLAVVRGKKAVSLERQVRIVAGGLVLLGSLLALWNIYFIWLAAFVGGGLMFAGITDTCGMAMLLAKMPWNRAGQEATVCAVPNKTESTGTPSEVA